MRFRKRGEIGNEAVGLGPAAIEAEVVHLLHSDAPHTGSNMLLGLTPGLEGSRIQDEVLGSVVLEKSIQRFESASLGVEALAQGALQIHIALQGASGDENVAVALVIAVPPLHGGLCPEPEEKLRVNRPSLVVDTRRCSPQNDAQECRRWF
jgi:hypothetical protein